MLFDTEELDFGNLDFDQVHGLAPKRSLGEFSWDTRVDPIPLLEYDIQAYRRAVNGFHQRLTLLRCARNTRHSPTDAQVETFTRYLVENQRDNPDIRLCHGSWAIPEDTAMPGDAAIDFAYVPTYLAIAWLVLVKQRYPRVARSVKGLDRAIRLGLRFAFTRNLYGSGHDGNRELLKAVEYLSLGTVFSYLSDNQNVYPRLADKIRDIESKIMWKLPKIGGFSSTKAYSRQRALQLIRGGDTDDSLVCPPIWYQWKLSQTAWAYNRVLEMAPALAAEGIFPSVKQKAVEVIQKLREAFHEVKPKHAVFGRPRQVTSDSLELDLEVSFDTYLDLAIERVGMVPWVDDLSTYGFMNALGDSFTGRLSSTLDYLFLNSTEFHEEEFKIKIAKIKKHEMGSKIHLCARG